MYIIVYRGACGTLGLGVLLRLLGFELWPFPQGACSSPGDRCQGQGQLLGNLCRSVASTFHIPISQFASKQVQGLMSYLLLLLPMLLTVSTSRAPFLRFVHPSLRRLPTTAKRHGRVCEMLSRILGRWSVWNITSCDLFCTYGFTLLQLQLHALQNIFPGDFRRPSHNNQPITY